MTRPAVNRRWSLPAQRFDQWAGGQGDPPGWVREVLGVLDRALVTVRVQVLDGGEQLLLDAGTADGQASVLARFPRTGRVEVTATSIECWVEEVVRFVPPRPDSDDARLVAVLAGPADAVGWWVGAWRGSRSGWVRIDPGGIADGGMDAIADGDTDGVGGLARALTFELAAVHEALETAAASGGQDG